MPTVEHTMVLDVPAARVWATVRDFGDDSWTGVAITVEGDGVGAVRTVAMPTGPIVERCERLDDDAMVLGYEVLSGNFFPVTEQQGTVAVQAMDDRRCELTWTSIYEPEPDAPDLTEDLTRFLRIAAGALRRHLEGHDDHPATPT